MERCAIDNLAKIVSDQGAEFQNRFDSLEGMIRELMGVMGDIKNLAKKSCEGQTVYIVDGNVNSSQQQNGIPYDPHSTTAPPNQCPTPTPPSSSGDLQQPMETEIDQRQQEINCTNVSSPQAGITQPTTPVCSGESLQHLVEAAEIHSAARGKDVTNCSQQVGENEESCSGDWRSRDGVVTRLRNRKSGVEEIPTSQSVTVYDGDHSYLRGPVQAAPNKFFCAYCPRQFEHKHSRSLHIQSCKRKHEEALKNSKVVGQQDKKSGNCSDLDVQGSKPKKIGDILKKKLGKMIKCGYCERTFPTQHQVNSHERVHTGDRPFSCYICEVKFAHGGNMIKHIKSKHPNYNPYVCRYCQCTFKTNPGIQNHRKECNPARRVVVRRRTSETYNSSDNSLDTFNKERQAQRNELMDDGEETATASESEDDGIPQDRRILPEPTSNVGYSSFLPEPTTMVEIKNEPNPDSPDDNANAYSNGPFHPFPLGSTIRHAQYTATSTYQCKSATGSPLLREIKVELSQTMSMPTYPSYFSNAVPAYTLMENIKQEMPD